MNYEEFLKSKVIVAPESGFDVDPERMNGSLFEWQRDIVRWSLKKGKAALFEDCGLGKTIQQLEFAAKVSEHQSKPVLIVAPLAVADQTRREGKRFGYHVQICRTQRDVTNGINITNYEMLEHFDAAAFGGGGAGRKLHSQKLLRHNQNADHRNVPSDPLQAVLHGNPGPERLHGAGKPG